MNLARRPPPWLRSTATPRPLGVLTMATLVDRKYRSEIMMLLPTAMTVFVLTVVIGILNGTDIVLFDHQELLAHVHAGTLGWITLSVFASALWLFGGPDDGTPGLSLI